MSAEKKPGEPAEIPPFLQKRGTAKPAAPERPAAPAKPSGGEEPSGIPFFLRGGAGRPPVPPRIEPKLAPAATPSPGPEATAPTSPTPAEPVAHGGLLSADEVQKALAEAQAERLRTELEAEAERLAYLQDSQIAQPKDAAPAKPAYKPVDWDSAAEIFDHMVTGIRRERAENKREEHERKRSLETDWQHVVQSMQALQRKVQGHRKVIYFNISRDQREISVKLVDESSKHKFRHITLTRNHPSGRYHQMEVVWFIEFAGRERYFVDAKEAMAELVTSIAAALA
jgi:hypothetical protein